MEKTEYIKILAFIHSTGGGIILKIGNIGEFGLIDRIRENTINNPATVVAGIGDDAAVLLATPRQLQLFTADMMVEGVHFTVDTIESWQLGYKALAVNISDIAAMGGTPTHAVVSLALPEDISVEYVEGIYDGMKELARQHRVNIVGGDTVASKGGLVINVALLGEVEPARLVRRSGARKGDLVVVSGDLGRSAAGLKLLGHEGWEEYSFAGSLVNAHLTPTPRVMDGRRLAAAGATSMNDISDGLASELNEIAAASKVRIRIQGKDIPISQDTWAASILLDYDPMDWALYGGEDYELVFTIGKGEYEKLMHVLQNEAGYHVVGEVVDEGENYGVELADEEGGIQVIRSRGYNHFSGQSEETDPLLTELDGTTDEDEGGAIADTEEKPVMADTEKEEERDGFSSENVSVVLTDCVEEEPKEDNDEDSLAVAEVEKRNEEEA